MTLVALLVLVLSPLYPLRRLGKMDVISRFEQAFEVALPQTIFGSIVFFSQPWTAPYKMEYWYFEFVILIRRLLFSLVISFPFGSTNVTVFLLLTVLTTFLGIEIFTQVCLLNFVLKFLIYL